MINIDEKRENWQQNFVQPGPDSPLNYAPPAAPDAIREGWQGHLAGVEQFARPIDAPWAGGSPTQRRRDAEEAKRQFEERMKWEREQFNAQMALQRAAQRAAQKGADGTGDPSRRQELTNHVYELVETALRQGVPFSKVKSQIERNQGLWGSDMSEADAVRLAQSFYEGNFTPKDFAGGVNVGTQSNIKMPFQTQYGAVTDILTGKKRDKLYDAALQDLQKFIKPPELPQMQHLQPGLHVMPGGKNFQVDHGFNIIPGTKTAW